MGKKGTARCTPIKEIPLKMYEIGYEVNEKMEKNWIEATSVVIDGDDLIIYQHISGLDEQVGGFKNWCYFHQVPNTNPQDFI